MKAYKPSNIVHTTEWIKTFMDDVADDSLGVSEVFELNDEDHAEVMELIGSAKITVTVEWPEED